MSENIFYNKLLLVIDILINNCKKKNKNLLNYL